MSKLTKIIPYSVKKILVKSAAKIFRFLFWFKTVIVGFAKLISKLLFRQKTKELLFSLIIVPLYRIYLIVKKIFNHLYSPQKRKNKILFIFSKRYLVHVTIIIIALMTVAANLNAYEVQREDIAETSVLANLVLKEDLGLIEVEGPIPEGKRITSYLDTTGVESPPQQISEDIPDETLPSTVQGGSAVVKPLISPAEAEIRKRDKIIYYTVEEGDNVNYIAKIFGLKPSTVLWANNLTSYSIIRPGDKLTILPVDGLLHKVVRGDTIAKIAKKYDTDAEKIIEFNKLASADDIQIGEKLIVPGGTKPRPVYRVRSSWVPPASTVRGTGRMLWPATCRRITTYFGWRHSGLDIACSYGSPIYAADSGTVIKAQGGWNGGYGIMVIIDHGNGIQTLYGHLSKLYIRVGDKVSKGAAIGAMGSTGRSTGSHVHFEVRTGGYRRNPLGYIR